jgi:hypothetical protein
MPSLESSIDSVKNSYVRSIKAPENEKTAVKNRTNPGAPGWNCPAYKLERSG